MEHVLSVLPRSSMHLAYIYLLNKLIVLTYSILTIVLYGCNRLRNKRAQTDKVWKQWSQEILRQKGIKQ